MRKKSRMPVWALLEMNDYEDWNRFYPSLVENTQLNANEPSMSGIEFLEKEELIPNEKAYVFPAVSWDQQGG